jgi:hypothetical protein
MEKKTCLFIILSIAMCFVSCKKDSDSSNPGNYYFKAKLDGSSTDFSTNVSAIKAKLAQEIYSLTIIGITSTEECGITLWSDKDDFTAGKTFTIDALNGTTVNSILYASPIGSSAPNSQWTSTYLYSTVPEGLTCTITEATATYIKGTFSGVIYQNNEVAVIKKSITEGQFYAKF